MSDNRADFGHQNQNGTQGKRPDNMQRPMQRQGQPQQKKGQAPPPLPEGSVSDEISVITEGMTVKGDVVSDGSIEVNGVVEGSIQIRGKLDIKGGRINGGSRAGSIVTDNAKIIGDLASPDVVLIGAGSVVEGNISGTKAVIAGAVKGNLDVHGPVVLDTTAVVLGDIKSESIVMQAGAVMDGKFSQCYAEITPESFFKQNGLA